MRTDTEKEVRRDIDGAVLFVDIAYGYVSHILQSSSDGGIGATDDLVQALMMNVFDLRNGLKLCALAEEKKNGMVDIESIKSIGHRDESCSHGSSHRCYCSRR